jgi:hypothetical protein
MTALCAKQTTGVDVQPSLATAVKPRKAGCLAAGHTAFAAIAAVEHRQALAA